MIEAWSVAQPKTKLINEVVARIAPIGKILLVDDSFSVTAAQAARNIERVSLQEAAKLNAKDLAQYKRIIVSSKGLEKIIARVNGGKN